MPKVRILMAGRPRLRKGDPGGLAYDSRGRHKATRLEHDVMFFRCPCGLEYGIDYGNAPVPHKLTGDGLVLMFKRWQDGSSAAPCPDCLRAYRRTGKLPSPTVPSGAVRCSQCGWPVEGVAVDGAHAKCQNQLP